MPTAPGFGDISVQLSLAGMTRPAYVTFGVDATPTDPIQVCDQVVLAWQAAGSMVSLLDAQVTLTQVRCSLGTDGGEDLIGVSDPNQPGTNNVSALPPNCAVLIHKVTTRGGRRGRGRLFLPWVVSETNVDEAGIIATATVGAISTAVEVFRSQLSTRGVPMVILHGPGQTAPGAPNVVTALICDKLLSTQRRRLGR